MKNKVAKRILALFLAVSMIAMSACGKEEEPADAGRDSTVENTVENSGTEESEAPEDAQTGELSVTDGIFDGSYAVEGYGTQENYIHFYEMDENSGKSMFYFSIAGGNLGLAGYYTVEETPFDYTAYPTHEDKANQSNEISGTAPFTVTLTDMSGTVLGSMGYDNVEGVLFNVECEGVNSGMLGYNYMQDPASPHTAADENGIVLQKFEAPDDKTCFVEINHNYTYADYMVMQVLGTWSCDADGRVYTLTSEDGTADAVLTISEDGLTAVYEPAGGEAVELAKPVAELSAQYFAETDMDIGEGNTMHFYMMLNLYEDNTVEMLQSYAEGDTACEQGTTALTGQWALNEGAVIVVLNGESYAEAEDGTIDIMGSVFAKAPGALLTMTGETTTSYGITVHVELGLYDGGTVEGAITYSDSTNVLQEVPVSGTYDTMDYNGAPVFTAIHVMDADYEIVSSMEGMSIEMPMDLSQMGGNADDVITVGFSFGG